MLSIIGLQGNDWVLLAADSSISTSIICLSEDFDRLIEIDKKTILAMSGQTGDTLQLSNYIQGNIALYKFKNAVELSTEAKSHYIRGVMAEAVRKNPYEVNMLLGGHDGTPSLYYIDYLGTLQKIPFGAQGYCAYFVMSLFDNYYKKDMTLDEGIELLKKVLTQIKTRFTVAPHGFVVKKITPEGIERLDIKV